MHRQHAAILAEREARTLSLRLTIPGREAAAFSTCRAAGRGHVGAREARDDRWRPGRCRSALCSRAAALGPAGGASRRPLRRAPPLRPGARGRSVQWGSLALASRHTVEVIRPAPGSTDRATEVPWPVGAMPVTDELTIPATSVSPSPPLPDSPSPAAAAPLVVQERPDPPAVAAEHRSGGQRASD